MTISTIIFLVLFLGLPVFWAQLLKKANINLLAISFPMGLAVAVFLYQYIGYPLLFFRLDNYIGNSNPDEKIIWQIFLWSCYTITMVFFGFFASKKTFGPLKYHQQNNTHCKPVYTASKKELWIMFTVFCLSLAVLCAYISKVGWRNIALLSVLGIVETNTTLGVLRSEMGNAFGGKYHRYSLFIRDFLCISSVGFFSFWLINKNRFVLLLFLGSFVMTSFSVLIATEKGPFIWYIIMLFFAYNIIKKGQKISKKQLMFIIAISFFIIGLMYILFYQYSSFCEGIRTACSRIVNGQMIGLYYYKIIFPEIEGYLYGKSFPNPGGIFWWEPISVTVLVNNIINPKDAIDNIVGSMPTFFWGEMYANFGYCGILFPPFFVGYTVYALNILMFRLPATPFILAIFLWTLRYIADISGTGLSGYIINVPGIIMAGLIIFVLLICQKKNIYLNKNRILFKKKNDKNY